MSDAESNSEAQQRTAEIFRRLNEAADGRWETTAVQETRQLRDPFRTVVSSMLSARTREEDTRRATNNLFTMAQTPAEMLNLSDEQLREAIRMTTYWENKVRYLRGLCEQLVRDHDGEVPRDLESLMALPGVGWKTATLTQWIAFGIAEEICVDVHVARIGKRLGLVNPKTKQPRKISHELMPQIPREIWGPWNPMMVRFGREVCFPNRPNCPGCPLNDICPKVGV